MPIDVVQSILDEQKQIYQQYREGTISKDTIPYIAIVFDDVISDKVMMRYEQIIYELAFSGRHYFIFIVLCVQDIKLSINS